jgi:type I restriction enzyme R subunit
MFVNGIPLVVGEAKTPVRPAVTWFDAAHDINVVYENSFRNCLFPMYFHLLPKAKKYL